MRERERGGARAPEREKEKNRERERERERDSERGRERNRERDRKREREGWGVGKETERERGRKITLGEIAFAPKNKRKERQCAHEEERDRLMANETKKQKHTPLSRAPDYNKITQLRTCYSCKFKSFGVMHSSKIREGVLSCRNHCRQ